MESLMRLKSQLPLPAIFYTLCLDLFSVIQFWTSDSCGTTRGREFEKLFCNYCRYKNIPMSEQPGSRTLGGHRSASGFMHEQDAVISFPKHTFHFELKHWTEPLTKNELLIFVQKGLDFLMGSPSAFRLKPLYRLLVSGSVLRPEARRFALQWGVVVIEPDRLPIPVIQYLSSCLLKSQGFLPQEVEVHISKWIVSAQETIFRAAEAFQGNSIPFLPTEEDWFLTNIQRNQGDYYWMALDEELGSEWLENRFDTLSNNIGVSFYN